MGSWLIRKVQNQGYDAIIIDPIYKEEMKTMHQKWVHLVIN